MIVRVLGEGQFDVPDEKLEALNQADEQLVRAVEQGDQESFASALRQLLSDVREWGRSLPSDHLAPSDLILPASDATIEEVRGLLSDEGLIPG